MKIVNVHEVQELQLSKDLSDFDLITFDDGLYSQFKHRKHFEQFNKPMIFFISTNIVNQGGDQITTDCRSAHENHFKNKDNSAYMTWEQIEELSKVYTIGGHSHIHRKYEDIYIIDMYFCLTHDTEMMMDEFKKHNITVTDFAFPYNKEYMLYREILKRKGLTTFYGKERINIEDVEKTL